MAANIVHGRICYLEIPALDVEGSSAFYQKIFGWLIRRRSDGALAFDDLASGVSGSWIVGRPPQKQSGHLLYVLVRDVEETQKAIIKAGGEILQPLGFSPTEKIAVFSDPYGNEMGIYQESKI